MSVPSRYYRACDPGNERLLVVEAWKPILRGFSLGRAEYYRTVRKAKNAYLRLALMLTSMNSNQSSGQAARKVPK